MTNNIHDDGGAAFPQAAWKYMPENGKYVESISGGMSLRDWFAGQAIGGIIIATSSGFHTPGQKHGTTVVNGMAIDAYELADAMLAARSKP